MILGGYRGGWGQPSNVYLTLTITSVDRAVSVLL